MASKMPLLREPAALACSALRARPRHRVLGASPEGSLTSDCDVDNIRTTMITRWHNTHANLDPTNSPTQSELRGDVHFKVCTRVLLHRAPLPPLPDPFIPMPQLVVDAAMGSKRVNWSCLAPHCRRVCDIPLCAYYNDRRGNSV